MNSELSEQFQVLRYAEASIPVHLGAAGKGGVADALRIVVYREAKSGEYSFKHALVRDALYQSLLTAPRTSLHLRIAEEIERKIRALRHHHSQVMKTRIEGTAICEIAQASAHFRGVQGRVRWAEGFAPLRLFINITEAPAVLGPARRRRRA